MSDVTLLIDRWNAGDGEALKALIAEVYAELRRMAGGLLRDERSDHTLQATALVNEAYLRPTGTKGMRIENRRHFYGAAATAMRRILVDHARTHRAQKRGGPEMVRVPLDEAMTTPIDRRLDFERLDQALDELAANNGDPVGPRDGAVVGPWRLLDKIGAGGMGDVYLAERDDGVFEGRAAIKFTRAHVPDMDAARRFRAERQFLASLHHANIVTLLDGGTTEGGQGYLVMEYVDGTPITAFCQTHALTLDARLA